MDTIKKNTEMKTETKKTKKTFTPRVIIEKVTPQIDSGVFPVKRVMGESVVVRANVFGDGHDDVTAKIVYRAKSEKVWNEVLMNSLGNDRWIGSFTIKKEEDYYYSLKGYSNEFGTWRKDFRKKMEADQDVSIDIKIGVNLIVDAALRCEDEMSREQLNKFAEKIGTAKKNELISVVFCDELYGLMLKTLDEKTGSKYEKDLTVIVDRKLALFSSWYELFPRSWGKKPLQHGTFKDCERLLPEISKMGFDIIYFPPINPVGTVNRKGKNNSVKCEADDPGCPWAIGSKDGGHKSINPALGTMEDLKHFIGEAKKLNIEFALDIAFQCAPDHPYVKEHPKWFKWRPDGTVQFAENPPKKYEDILPINFESEDWENLWNELKGVFLFWIKQGITVFRVDNPHTKPFLFWDWVISEIKKDHPQVIFLSESFTRPNVMSRLAKGGFTQSYTYFTWRYTKKDFMEYMTELTKTEVAEYLRPNFWPNTPDILAVDLQNAPREAFIRRAILAATLSSNYGIYGPAFELCVAEPFPGKEEYNDSEKYEIKKWDWDSPGNIKGLITKLNMIRRENPAMQMTRNIRFCEMDNDNILAFYKATGDYSNIILVVINMDINHKQAGWLKLPLNELGIDSDRNYVLEDLLNDNKYTWQCSTNYIELDPKKVQAHIFKVTSQNNIKREFDYFM